MEGDYTDEDIAEMDAIAVYLLTTTDADLEDLFAELVEDVA